MSSRKMLVAWLMVAVVFSAMDAAQAARRPRPQVVTITGSVTAADAENNYAATVDADDGTEYKVIKSAMGLKLAREADGKKAEIQATVRKRGQEMLMTVRGFKIVEEDEDEEDEGEDDDAGEDDEDEDDEEDEIE